MTFFSFARAAAICAAAGFAAVPGHAQKPAPPKVAPVKAKAAPAKAALSKAAPTRPPNVLFIVLDDLNVDIGCYGYPYVKTPNIDRLAKRGVRFERAYCQVSWCNPSRVSFLSGLRPESTGIYDLSTPPREVFPNRVFLNDHFKQQGYFTARVGKVYHEAGRNGDEARWQDAEKWDISEEGQGKGPLKVARKGVITGRGTRSGQGGFPGLEWTELDTPDEAVSDGVISRRVAQIIEQAAKDNKPFFAAAGFRKPHLPWVAPKKYFDMYKSEDIPIPIEPAGHLDNVPGIAKSVNPQGPPLSDADIRQGRLAYHACTSFVDAQVGILLDTLDRLKLTDNTIVVLWGDHGYHLGEHNGMWEKVRLWEEAANAPLIFAGPGIVSGAACARTVEFVDVYPTLNALCHLPAPPDKLEGTSLLPLLKDPKAAWDKPAYTLRGMGKNINGRSVRTEKWHYIEWANGAQLYDSIKDPHEYVNLAPDPKFAETVAQMKTLLQRTKQLKPINPLPDPALKKSPPGGEESTRTNL